MDVGQWLGAIPNAVGKLLYDAGIPDPMAQMYGEKQKYDLYRQQKQAVIDAQNDQRDLTDVFSGAPLQTDKAGNPVYRKGLAGRIEQDIYANKMPIEDVVNKYGAALSLMKGMSPDKLIYAGTAPDARKFEGLVKSGLAMNVKDQAHQDLEINKFKHAAILDNATKAMTVLGQMKDQGVSQEEANIFMNNFAAGLATIPGMSQEMIKALLVPMQEVAEGRKDVDLASKVMLRNVQAAAAQSRAAAAWAKANKPKEYDMTHAKLDPETDLEKIENEKMHNLLTKAKLEDYKPYNITEDQDGFPVIRTVTPEEQLEADKITARQYFGARSASRQAMMEKFAEYPDLYQRGKRARYTDKQVYAEILKHEQSLPTDRDQPIANIRP